jgi:hypothetical protein
MSFGGRNINRGRAKGGNARQKGRKGKEKREKEKEKIRSKMVK